MIQERFNDLVVATYGRGFFILDDLSPLQQLSPEITTSSAHLFAPRPAYRFTNVTGNYSTNDDPTAGSNPPYGAAINYWLKSAAPVVIEILDAAGKSVRTINDSTTRAGLNRTYWDLRNTTPKAPRLRTKPMYNAEFTMNADGTRDAPGMGSISVLMPPGKYTVKLTASGQTFTQPLEVLRDPNQAETLADIRASANALLALQKDHAGAGEMLNQIERVRSQIQALGSADVRAAGDSLEHKFMDVEGQLVDLRMTGRGQDEVRWPVQAAGQLNYLAGGIAASDFAPTTQQREVQGILARNVRATRGALDQLLAKDLPAFNALLRAKGLKIITVETGVIF